MEGFSIDKSDFKALRSRLEEICKTSRIIHVDISTKRKKLDNVTSRIEGIYDRFLCVSSLVNSYTEDFTISYIDILTKKIHIKELQN